MFDSIEKKQEDGKGHVQSKNYSKIHPSNWRN